MKFALKVAVAALLAGTGFNTYADTHINASADLTKVNSENSIDLSKWQLVWRDEFDYPNNELDKVWWSQNAPSLNLHSSRWRENVIVEDGILRLENRKEQRGGQDWTSGSIRTKEKFGYGYFEARYKYAGASATNNSFWLMTYPLQGKPEKGKFFEIDINEGHFPNEVNTNIHNWSDSYIDKNGKKRHPSSSKTFAFGTKPHYRFPMELEVKTKKIRFSSKTLKKVTIRKFNVFDSFDTAKRTNFAQDKNLKVTVSGHFRASSKANHLTDDSNKTAWISQEAGEKWFEYAWPTEKTIKEIEFVNGWKSDKGWQDLITNYQVQYWTGSAWKDIATLDIEQNIDFSETFHTYGCEWNENEIIFYFDGKEIRREKNEFAHIKAPIWLSLAIIKWDGPLTDKVDGTSMKVDYVRYYQPKK